MKETRHIHRGSTVFRTDNRRDHLKRVIAARRAVCFGEDCRVISDEAPSPATAIGA